MSGHPRPVWLLDIDGVLNAYAYQRRVHDEWEDVDHRRLKIPHHGTFPLWVAGEVLAFVRGVHDATLADILWCTTWLDAANEVFAPAFGLPEFPVGGRPAGITDYTWKSDAARAVAASGRALVWTDDDAITEQDRRLLNQPHHLLLSPDPRTGLDADDLRLIEEHLLTWQPTA